MSPKEKNIVKPKQKVTNATEKKSHKFLLSLVLLATLLKYYKHKINIPVENLIANNLIPKKNI